MVLVRAGWQLSAAVTAHVAHHHQGVWVNNGYDVKPFECLEINTSIEGYIIAVINHTLFNSLESLTSPAEMLQEHDECTKISKDVLN